MYTLTYKLFRNLAEKSQGPLLRHCRYFCLHVQVHIHATTHTQHVYIAHIYPPRNIHTAHKHPHTPQAHTRHIPHLHPCTLLYRAVQGTKLPPAYRRTLGLSLLALAFPHRKRGREGHGASLGYPPPPHPAVCSNAFITSPVVSGKGLETVGEGQRGGSIYTTLGESPLLGEDLSMWLLKVTQVTLHPLLCT